MREIGPQSHLLIPGLNPYLPWTYGWIALVVTIIIHEAGHGIVARVHNIKIESTGSCPIQTALNATDTQASTVERNIFQQRLFSVWFFIVGSVQPPFFQDVFIEPMSTKDIISAGFPRSRKLYEGVSSSVLMSNGIQLIS